MQLSGKLVRIRLTVSSCHISILLALVLIVRDVGLCITISSCYGSISLVLVLIGRNGGLGTLCHSCGFACRERMLKTFPGPEKWISTTTKNATKLVNQINLHCFIFKFVLKLINSDFEQNFKVSRLLLTVFVEQSAK